MIVYMNKVAASTCILTQLSFVKIEVMALKQLPLYSQLPALYW